MPQTVAIIAPGEMGAATGRRLREHGALILTMLAGRSAASAARAERAGFAVVDDAAALAAQSSILLSIVPPGAALGLAERLAPALAAAPLKPLYVDCNAVSPATAQRIAAVIAGTGCRFVDAGIIGPPPAGNARTVFYAAGEAAPDLLPLTALGLDLRLLEGPVGAASALKMSYAGLTKGIAALGSAIALGAESAGTTAALLRELGESQPHLLPYLARLPGMFPKAYRWVAEMEEIGGFLSGHPPAEALYRAMARLYEHLAAGAGAPGSGDLAAIAAVARKAAAQEAR
jgi:putative dehydrogenase